MILPVNTWFAALVLLACTAHVAPRDPLSYQVRQFSIGKTTALDALLWLGRDEQISFGIEFYGSDLSKIVEVKMDDATVGEIAQKILGSTDSYQLSVSGTVILIRRKGERPPDWLNHLIPRFIVPKGELMFVNSELCAAIEGDLDPTIRGFGGDYPATNPLGFATDFASRALILVRNSGLPDPSVSIEPFVGDAIKDQGLVV